MTCDERRDSIFLFAAGELEPAQTEALRLHLSSGCPPCAGALAEAQATLAQMTLALDPISPSQETGDALMARIARTGLATPLAAGVERSRSTEKARPPQAASLNSATDVHRWRLRIFSAAFLSAAAAVAITSGIFLYATRTQREFFRSSNLQTVSLASDLQPGARGQVLWDRDHSQWHVSVFNLAPLPAGKEYELWFIPPSGKPLRSKTFSVDENGKASLIVQVPTDIGPIAVAAITDEPAGGVNAPTGKIQLAGKVSG